MFLTEPETQALIDAPDRATWIDRRDHALLMLAAQTGLRASELIDLSCTSVHLGVGAHVSCTGKGRKQRMGPRFSPVLLMKRRRELGAPGEQRFDAGSVVAFDIGPDVDLAAVKHELDTGVAAGDFTYAELSATEAWRYLRRGEISRESAGHDPGRERSLARRDPESRGGAVDPS